MATTKTQVVKFIRQGDKGEPGEQGPPGQQGDPGDKGDKGDRGPALRGPQYWNDCPVGYMFEAGGEGESWKDVVIYNNNYYSCVKSHFKSAGNYPGSSSDTTNGFWQLGDKIELVATRILLAAYALIKNLGVECIDMKDADGNVLFQAKDGEVTCKTGTFDNITVHSGKIAGFTVSDNGLTNGPDFDNDAYVVFRNDEHDCFAGIGGNVLPTSGGGLRAVARFENHDTKGWWIADANYGMIVSARGAIKNTAVYIDGGAVSGMAMKNTLISNTEISHPLDRHDYNVIAMNDSECTLTLPSMQLYDDGHVIRIKRLGKGALKIALNSCYTYKDGVSHFSTPCLIHDQNEVLTGISRLSVDSICDAMELVWCRDIVRTVGATEYYGAWLQYKLPRDW